MELLGIDTGSIYTGYSSITIINDEIREVSFGVHEFKESFPQRLVEASVFAQDIINQYNPQLIIAENYGYGGGFFNKEVPEIFSQFKRVFHLNNKPLVLVAPNSAKKSVTGNGKATKSQVRKSVLEYIKNVKDVIYDPKVVTSLQDHSTDSLAIIIALLKADKDSSILRELISVLKFYKIGDEYIWKLTKLK
jgi:Holliday junction resolvasome RuvABC endonuclease subunit